MLRLPTMLHCSYDKGLDMSALKGQGLEEILLKPPGDRVNKTEWSIARAGKIEQEHQGPLPSKVVFHRWSSSIKGRLPLKVVFH